MSSYNPSTSPVITQTVSSGGPPPPGAVDYIVLIAMENQDYASVIGNGQAPFVNSLLSSPPAGQNSATIPQYHGAYPGSSEGSYIAQISGDTYGASNGTTGIGNASTPTILDRFISAGRTYEVYREDSNGRGGDHFPFLCFNSIVSSPAKMAHVHSGASPSDIVSQINSQNPPNFLWLTPNDGNNMHDNSVSSGDAYLSQFVPSILSAPVFQQGRALLMLWWDEFDPCPNVWVGAKVKPFYVSQAINLGHYSTLRLIENLWGMAPMSNGPSFPSGDIGAVPLDILQ